MTGVASRVIRVSAGVACAAVVMVTLCWDDTAWRDMPHDTRAVKSRIVPSGSAVALDVTVGESANYPVIVRRPEGPPLVNLAGVDPQGRSGKLACYACHNPDQSDALRLADGSPVAYRNVMTMCSQCHSAQATSFAHGAHGGMNGHWDLSRGSQTKNNCIDCHDPHAPSYPKMVVGFKPRDRFLEKEDWHGDHE